LAKDRINLFFIPLNFLGGHNHKMERLESEKIIELMCEADGRCKYCARALIKHFIKIFPQFSEEGKTIYIKHFGAEEW
jgi:hypothetical protein